MRHAPFSLVYVLRLDLQVGRWSYRLQDLRTGELTEHASLRSCFDRIEAAAGERVDALPQAPLPSKGDP
jgi:hypothetical protein